MTIIAAAAVIMMVIISISISSISISISIISISISSISISISSISISSIDIGGQGRLSSGPSLRQPLPIKSFEAAPPRGISQRSSTTSLMVKPSSRAKWIHDRWQIV
jgi:hypothetical protein